MKKYVYEGPVGYGSELYTEFWKGTVFIDTCRVRNKLERAREALTELYRFQYGLTDDERVCLYFKYLFEA